MPDNRPAPRVGPVEFSLYDSDTQPMVDTSTSARYAEHQVIGGENVYQKMGKDATKVTITGEATQDEAKQVERLTEGEEYELRTPRKSGVIRVKDTNTKATGEKRRGDFVYTYTIVAYEV